jgi:DNA-binding PadR family transcriptional regulator
MRNQHSQEYLSYPAFLILDSLLEEPKTITALRQAVAQETGQVIKPTAFSLAVIRLERHGWITSENGAERVRLYRVTMSGIFALQKVEDLYRRDQEEQEWNGWAPDMLGGKEIIMRLVLWILRLYPLAWRERYETEMAALLEQHHLTLWTVLDLLVGVLDTRLDPHYRRERQLLPLRRLRTSWQMANVAFMVFWIALLPWFWLSVLGIDPSAQCENWGAGFALCNMRVTMGMHTTSLAHTLLANILGWLPVLLMALAGILARARGRKARSNLLLAFLVTVAMFAVCIASGIWLNSLRPLLPQISQFYPLAPAGLLAGLLAMGLATALALGALLRAVFELRTLSATAPKQESHAFSSNTEESASIPDTDMARLEYHITPAGRSSISRVSMGWKVLLVILLLLFLFPWPNLMSSDSPDMSGLLITWGLAGIVGIITAWLVKLPGSKQEQRVTPQQRRGLPPLLLAVILPLPYLIWSVQVSWNTLPDVTLSPAVKFGHMLISLLPPVFIGIITVLIVSLRRRLPRIGTTLKVWGIYLLSILYAFLFAQFAPMLPGAHPWGGLFGLLYLAIAICIIPALVVRVHNANKQATRNAQQHENEVSPKVWIVILPVVFLVFCTEVEFIGLPDYNNFGDVFVFWCMAGLASLIILLALKIGSRKRMRSLAQEMMQQVQAQG